MDYAFGSSTVKVGFKCGLKYFVKYSIGTGLFGNYHIGFAIASSIYLGFLRASLYTWKEELFRYLLLLLFWLSCSVVAIEITTNYWIIILTLCFTRIIEVYNRELCLFKNTFHTSPTWFYCTLSI